MDKYEKEFWEKIKQSAKEMVVDRVELGELRLKRLAAMIYLLIKEKQERFDLLMGGGNSGVAILEIVKMVYQKAGVDVPPIALFPVIRPSNKEEVNFDKSLIVEQLKDIKKLDRLLFVDDEIMRAQTAKICFELIRDFLGETKVNPCLSCTIVAENHFFVWRYELKGISVRFLPFSMVLQGYNGNFGYLIPQKLITSLSPVLGEPIDRNKALALLLGGKIKVVKDKIASFDYEIEKEIMSKVPGYSNEKQEFIERIEKIVDEGIEEYKKGEIRFRYLP